MNSKNDIKLGKSVCTHSTTRFLHDILTIFTSSAATFVYQDSSIQWKLRLCEVASYYFRNNNEV